MKSSIYALAICIIATTMSLNAQNPLAPSCDPVLPEVVPDDPPVLVDNQLPPVKPPSSPPPATNTRLILWLHGLGGSEYSWSTAADAVEQTYETSYLLPTYVELGLSNAESYLRNEVFDVQVPIKEQSEGITDPSTSYIIAHSQGGVVARAMDRHFVDTPSDTRRYGGLVTFGTPHYGAQILNNVDQAFNFADRSCVTLAQGPSLAVQEDLEFLFTILNVFGTGEDEIENLVGSFCNIIADDVLPSLFEQYQTPITASYKVGSEDLASLNSQNSPIPAVAFYGVEEEPAGLRQIHSLLNPPEEEPAFTAVDDESFISVVDRNALRYETEYRKWQLRYDVASDDGCSVVQWLFNPLGCLMQFTTDDILNLDGWLPGNTSENEAREIRDAYKDGWRWWLNLNDNYKSLFGARERVQVSSQLYCRCEYSDPHSDYYDHEEISPIDDPSECSTPGENWSCETYTEVGYETREYPFDGVVLKSSAESFPGADSGPDNELTGSNHQQMRNDENLRNELIELFAGNHGRYFITHEK